MSWDDNKTANDPILSDDWDAMVADQKGRVIGTGVNEAIADTAANRPAAGTVGRLFFETDTGRVLYDNGTSWVEVGLSESEISLANLGSNSYADLSDGTSFPIPNTDLSNSSLTVANTSISLGGSGTPEADNLGGNNGTSGQVLQSDGTNASWADLEFETVNTINSDYLTSGETTLLLDEATTLVNDGFEDGDYTNNPSWTATNSSTFTVQTNTVFNGTYALETALVNDDYLELAETLEVSDNTAVSGWFRVSDSSSVSTNHYYSNTSNSEQGSDAIEIRHRGGEFRVLTYSSDGSTLIGDTGVFSVTAADPGNWYRFEVVFDVTNSEIDLNIYDSTNTLDTTRSISYSGATTYQYSGLISSTAFNMYVDDFDYQVTALSIDTVTLSSSDVSSGKIVRVKDSTGEAGTSNVTIETEGSETIDGSNSISLNTNYGVKQLQSDGSNWFVISDG